MDETQGSHGWCLTCGDVREFVPVPDTDRGEYACVACGAAMLVPMVQVTEGYATVA